ncbi:MAG TPA: phosphoribosylamine--glycine ligase, partial [Myxococcaceae bacterium]|nr:phosphoribosylamine--glycine ligase [Myxococcaceae bacterium]
MSAGQAEQIAVLVLGSGGREHALCWKLAQSPLLSKLWCAPGNPGTEQVAENVALDPCDPIAVVDFCRRHAVGLVVVGPEAPLVAGVSDALVAAGIPCFGPSAEAARIEGSKAFAKEIMQAAGVPTAAAQTFSDPQAAQEEARRLGRVVVKADGLAAGKGVIVATDPDEAADAVRQLSGLGAAGTRLVLEEVLEGEEVSVIALCDGAHHVLLPTSQDHKRVGEGDRGPNTGGMGAVSPVPFLDAEGLSLVQRQVIVPTLQELARRGTPFRGALYVGVMVTADGPKVLEFNARFGDPEAQVLLLRLSSDLLPVLLACAMGALPPETMLEAHPGFAAGVVLAAEGYPEAPKKGAVIRGLDDAQPDQGAVFLAGVGAQGGALVTTGG